MPGLEDLYREIILDHYRNPRNRGDLPVPPAHRVEGFNPLCGDEVVVFLDVDRDTIADHRLGGDGEVDEEDTDRDLSPSVPLGDLEALQGVVKFPVRIKCATLC